MQIIVDNLIGLRHCYQKLNSALSENDAAKNSSAKFQKSINIQSIGGAKHLSIRAALGSRIGNRGVKIAHRE